MSTLTFNNGQFILQRNGINASLSYREAYHYIACADVPAKRALRRLFQEFYSDNGSSFVDAISFLDHHQREGINWILSRSRSYLAHAPGAGKTCQAVIASMLAGIAGPILFIVPPSLTRNWAHEIDKFYELLKPLSSTWPSVSIVPKSNRKHFTGWRSDFIICPDSMITRKWVYRRLLSLKPHFIAIDEASRFKDAKALRTIALFGGRTDKASYPGLIYTARHVVLLDGSPMPNRPMELWAPLYACARDSIDFMDERQFGFRYCGPRINEYGRYEFKGSSNVTELNQKITKSFLHVVTEDKLSHPERLRRIIYTNIDVRSAAYKRWEIKELPKLNLDNVNEDSDTDGALAKFRHEIGLKKISFIRKYIDEKMEKAPHPIIIFAWHRDVIAKLSHSLHRYPHATIIGGIDDETRQQAFEKFQSGKISLLIGNIAAMGRGLNLQRADRIIFAEYSWCDETNKQAEKRAARKGRDEKLAVNVDYIVAPNTIDETILRTVMRKESLVKKVIASVS